MTHHILLLFGGESPEHDISLRSAHTIDQALQSTPHHVSYGYIDRHGQWWLVPSLDALAQRRPLRPLLGQRAFQIDNPSERLEPTVLFPILHGQGGEDGTVQGLAALLHLPCVGPSLLSAAITMDKTLTKQLASAAGVPVVPWHIHQQGQAYPDYEQLASQLGTTLFVKPSRTGSSVGVHKVRSAAELTAALDDALRYDDTVLIEQAVSAREIELAAYGHGKDVTISGAGEIIPGEEFYSYDDKYAADSASQTRIPADVDDETLATLQSYARTAYQATAGHGMARIDFFLCPDGQIFLNEINSIPGFTDISMYPKLWEAAGIPIAALVEQLITNALAETVHPVAERPASQALA